MGDHTNFLSILEGSKAVRDRWAALVERTVTDAARHGVSIEADDVLNLRSARTAALGAPLDEDEFRAEVLALPALSDAARKTAIAAGDVDALTAAVADLNRSKFEVTASRWTDNAARCLSQARDLGIATPPTEAFNISANERLDFIKEVNSPATKLALARKWGLL
ncbi:hypothetical protein [Sulfitobacter sp. EE-36]|uniref:hypothetical protein n=1 Tax=Sulfitobacter TaxID=60136 RepID=UPI000066B090|nr:hypothetical protein [Sulfitobacter sp. EE-36]EAP83951.1 hypothetical protein EE36_12833 [Sulfitobacter sp. EE-36]